MKILENEHLKTDSIYKPKHISFKNIVITQHSVIEEDYVTVATGGGKEFRHYGTLSTLVCSGPLCQKFEIQLLHFVKTDIKPLLSMSFQMKKNTQL